MFTIALVLFVLMMLSMPLLLAGLLLFGIESYRSTVRLEKALGIEKESKLSKVKEKLFIEW